MIDIIPVLVVAAASILGAALVVALCSVGLRLLVTPRVERRAVGHHGGATLKRRPLASSIGAYACFGLCGITILFAIYLIVPIWR